MNCNDCMFYDTDGFCSNLDSQMWGKTKTPDTTACKSFREFAIEDDCEECKI